MTRRELDALCDELGLPPHEDKLTRWRREAYEREQARAEARAELRAIEAAGRQPNIDIDALIEGIGRALGAIRRELHQEFEAKLVRLHTELIVKSSPQPKSRSADILALPGGDGAHKLPVAHPFNRTLTARGLNPRRANA